MNTLLEKYVPIVTFLGTALGEYTEVVLQDCENQCIVAIANGNVTKRSIGAPLTDLSLKIIADGCWNNQDFLSSYEGVSRDGLKLRSSTYFIKEEGNLIGMLCINRDISKPIQIIENLNQYLQLVNIQSESYNITNQQPIQDLEIEQDNNASKTVYTEKFNNSVSDVIDDAIIECLGENSQILLERLTQDERIKIVQLLDEQKLFLLKGAVSEVAQKLNCSEASIYRYLSKIDKK